MCLMACRGGTFSEELTICAFTCSERPSKKMVGKNPARRVPNVMYAARCRIPKLTVEFKWTGKQRELENRRYEISPHIEHHMACPLRSKGTFMEGIPSPWVKLTCWTLVYIPSSNMVPLFPPGTKSHWSAYSHGPIIRVETWN